MGEGETEISQPNITSTEGIIPWRTNGSLGTTKTGGGLLTSKHKKKYAIFERDTPERLRPLRAQSAQGCSKFGGYLFLTVTVEMDLWL